MSQVSGSPLRWLLPVSIAALAVWGVAQRVMTREALAREAQDAALPRVAVVQVQRASEAEQLTLPAELRARQEAPIYARTSGYLKAWHTDIGTPVKRGQLLAEIDTPEVDQQLAQARADLARAQADAALAQSTHERWQALRAADSVSQQEADQKAGAAATAQAALLSAKANLARLQQLSDFKRVLAPFDGVVVARNTDVGALISAGESSGGELFRVADLRSLRVYAMVPQLYADDMQPGLAAQISLSERPGAQYPAKLLRTAGALDAQTRSLQVELALDNAQAQLLPGAYAEVSFALAPHRGSLRVPANTVLFRAEGLQLATVDAQQRVHLKSIRLGRDFGTSLEVLEGLGADDQVVLNPSDSLGEGMQVRVVKPAAESKKAS